MSATPQELQGRENAHAGCDSTMIDSAVLGSGDEQITVVLLRMHPQNGVQQTRARMEGTGSRDGTAALVVRTVAPNRGLGA